MSKRSEKSFDGAGWGRRNLGLLAALSLAFSLVQPGSAAEPASGPSVSTPSGPIQGVWKEQDRVAAYLGVPFAQPPVGTLRFEKAVPAAPWSAQTLQATRCEPTGSHT